MRLLAEFFPEFTQKFDEIDSLYASNPNSASKLAHTEPNIFALKLTS
jgi:hypothetical protein